MSRINAYSILRASQALAKAIATDAAVGYKNGLATIVVNACTNCIFSGCTNQEIGWTFPFKGIIIGTLSYLGMDSATKQAPPGQLAID
jgi:hypothetical protein